MSPVTPTQRASCPPWSDVGGFRRRSKSWMQYRAQQQPGGRAVRCLHPRPPRREPGHQRGACPPEPSPVGLQGSWIFPTHSQHMARPPKPALFPGSPHAACDTSKRARPLLLILPRPHHSGHTQAPSGVGSASPSVGGVAPVQSASHPSFAARFRRERASLLHLARMECVTRGQSRPGHGLRAPRSPDATRVREAGWAAGLPHAGSSGDRPPAAVTAQPWCSMQGDIGLPGWP